MKKGSIDKNKAKTTLSKLKKNNTYYVRIRLVGEEGTTSDWSKVLKIKAGGTQKKSTLNYKLTAKDVSARSNGRVTVKWDALRKKLKNNKLWKNAQSIEIQCSRNRKFTNNVKKVVQKGSIDKKKAKTTLSKLKKNKTYYLRVRLIAKDGTKSGWSKVVKFKTKK